ncbi:MAG: hypothetical protein LBO67_07940, partial [Spirochaetaceae bacterium]|nr:hypothetical protein [Spirochaetaceae bacterium]
SSLRNMFKHKPKRIDKRTNTKYALTENIVVGILVSALRVRLYRSQINFGRVVTGCGPLKHKVN